MQLVLRRASHERAPRDVRPVFEFHLFSHERIIGVEHYWTADHRSRSTVDHHVTVWVAADLRGPDA